jgi:iduronate 2-sulfatase
VKWVVLDGDGESDVDYHIAANGIRLLEKYKDQPFFIGIGFHKPHQIAAAPQKYYDLYDPAKIQLPPDFAPRPTLPPGIPAIALPTANDTYMDSDTSPEVAREVLRAYRASASWTDWNLGRVLGALERLGLAEKTIVVFTSDHGYHNGEKGRWGKTTVFEIAQRVPLIVRLPGAAGNGHACARMVQSLDLYPTLVELCGLPQPEGLQGHSYSALLQQPQAPWPYAAFSMAKTGGGPIGYCVRTERWRYAEWKGGDGGSVLFDEEHDPYETTNLADAPQQRKTVEELKAMLKKTFVNMPERMPTVARSRDAK